MIVGIDATPRVGIIGTILHRVQIEAQHPVCGYITIVGKARRLLRIDDRESDARIRDRCVDRRRGQRSQGRCGPTSCAWMSCVAASAGKSVKGKVTSGAEYKNEQKQDHGHSQHAPRRALLWSRIGRRWLNAL